MELKGKSVEELEKIRKDAEREIERARAIRRLEEAAEMLLNVRTFIDDALYSAGGEHDVASCPEGQEAALAIWTKAETLEDIVKKRAPMISDQLNEDKLFS